MPSTSSQNATVQHPFPPLPGKTPDALRRDMIVWAEPIIADCIGSAYPAGLAQGSRSLLTLQHRRLWRTLILEQEPKVGPVRGDLLRDAARAGLAPETVADVDRDILEELMDIVTKRCRASRDTGRGFGLILLNAASSLGAERRAA